MAKTERISVRLSPEDKAWTEGEADRLGLEASDIVRMAIRQMRRGELRPITEYRPDAEAERAAREAAEATEAERLRLEAIAKRKAELLAELNALEGGAEIAGDEPEDDIEADLAAANEYLAPQAFAPPPPSGGRPFSLTAPSGVNRDMQGNKMGDAHGNLVRTNYGHLGFRG